MKLTPRVPDAASASAKLAMLPSRLAAVEAAFRTANANSKRFPDWRERQILNFARHVELFVNDLKNAHVNRRIDLVAQAARNLIELHIWTEYCRASEQNAKRFYDDAARDMREVLESIQKLYSTYNGEPERKVSELLDSLRTHVVKFNVEDFDGAYKRVANAAKELGKEDTFGTLYKVASKLAHPTSLSLNTEPIAMLDGFLEIGQQAAYACVKEIEACTS